MFYNNFCVCTRFGHILPLRCYLSLKQSLLNYVNGRELTANSTSCNIVVNSMQLNLFFHNTFFNEFLTVATNDFTSPNFNSLKFTDTMIFRHPH